MSPVSVTVIVWLVRDSLSTSPYHRLNVPVAFGVAVMVATVPLGYVPSANGVQSVEMLTVSSKNVLRSTLSAQPLSLPE